MATHLIGYINKPTKDGRTIRAVTFREQVPVLALPNDVAPIGTHLGVATHFRIALDTGAVTCRTDVEVQADQCLCPDLGITESGADDNGVWVAGQLLGLTLMDRARNWSWPE